MKKILFFISFFGFVSLGNAFSVGPNSGVTFSDDSSTGTITWSGPGNAAVSDNILSSATLIGAFVVTHYINATNFSMSVPGGATITGVVVGLERNTTGSGTVKDNAIFLIKNGTIQGNNKATANNWTGTDTYEDHGGVNDTWGLVLTASDVNASDFGVAVAAQVVAGTTAEAHVDHIRITVYYTTKPTVIF